MSDTITGVAVMTDKGQVLALPAPARHPKLYALAAFCGVPLDDYTAGFMTSSGQFVNRTAARQIAAANGQILPGVVDRTELYSEDVWPD